MSQFVVYIRLKPFVKQWLVHSFGEPVRFPDQSDINSLIRRSTVKDPALSADIPAGEDDTIGICIPDSKAKDPMYYRYLTQKGVEAVAEVVEDVFRLSLKAELHPLIECGAKILTACNIYCEMHGISIDYAYTIKQRYYRARKKWQDNGIDLVMKTRNQDKW